MQVFLETPRKFLTSSNGCISLWTIFILLQLFTICVTEAARNDRRLKHRTSSRETVHITNGSLMSDARYDTTRDNIHLYAPIGHHFNRSLREEINKFDHTLLSSHHEIEVLLPSDRLSHSKWIVYDEDGTLQGIPLLQHKGMHDVYVTISHPNSPLESRHRLWGVVEVLSEDTALKSRHNHHRRRKPIDVDMPRSCPHDEPVTTVNLEVEIATEGLDYRNRLNLVRMIEEIFGVSSRDVVFSLSPPKSCKNTHRVLSGPGNAAKVRTHRGDRSITSTIILSWPLGCSLDVTDIIRMVESLETSSFDGTLARALGCDVIQWFVTNFVPAGRRRPRRNAKEASDSEVPHPFSRKRSADDVGGDSTTENGNISNTQAMTETTTAIPDPQPILAQDDEVAADFLANNAPMVLFGLANVNASMNTYMEFVIPNGVFYDIEDGMSYDMDMKVFDEPTLQEVGKDNTWLMYDAESHILYGVPDETAVAQRALLLMVTDSGGKRATYALFLYVNLTAPTKDSSHRYTFVLSESPTFQDDNKLYASFGRKLADAMAKVEKMPGDIVMIKTGVNKTGLRYVEWYDSSMSDTTNCQSLEIRNAATLMVGERATKGRNKPTREFAKKFSPEYKLKSIIIQFYGPCEGKIITTTTTTTTTMTTTTTTTAASTIVSTTPKSTTEATGGNRPQTAYTPTQSIPQSKRTPTQPVGDTTRATSTERMTTSRPRVTVLEKQLPTITAKTGIPSKYVIPQKMFNDINDLGTEPQISLMDSTSWIAFDSDSLALYVMATGDEVLQLASYNSSYKQWDGSLSVLNMKREKVAVFTFKILIERELDEIKNPNHKFVVIIKNYDLETFRSSERMRLVQVISDIFDEKTEDQIYMQPLKEGSVIVEWYNVTLGLVKPCPTNEIAKLGSAIFADEGSIKPSVMKRFQDSNFVTTDFKLKRTDSCPKEETATGSDPDLNAAGAQGKTTTILIIIVIIVCLVVIIAILVIKCRKNAVSKKNKNISKYSATHEETVILTPGSDPQDTPRIKKGVPIIFNDEIGVGENGDTHSTSATTPLVAKTPNEGVSNRSNYDGNLYVTEDTPPFISPSSNHPMTPPTPIMSNRPPPPYTKTR